jgi:hypothetical protein
MTLNLPPPYRRPDQKLILLQVFDFPAGKRRLRSSVLAPNGSYYGETTMAPIIYSPARLEPTADKGSNSEDSKSPYHLMSTG